MTDPNSIPALRDELERKTIDELTRLSNLAEQGVLAKGHFARTAKSLWNIVSGLIPLESLEMVARAGDSAPVPSESIHFFKDGDVTSITWNPDKDNFGVVNRGLSYPTTRVRKVDVDRLERAARVQKLVDGLVAARWIRL
jgi:hypothetical protein